MPQKVVTFRKKSPGFIALVYAGETFTLRGVSSKVFMVDSQVPNPKLSKGCVGISVSVESLAPPVSEKQIEPTPDTTELEIPSEPQIKIVTSVEENTKEEGNKGSSAKSDRGGAKKKKK